MNICSYVTAVGMKPKVMLVALYHGTKSRENIVVGEPVRLQLLAENQASLVRLLGQQSGKTINKVARLEKRSLVTYHAEWPYLIGVVGYLDLKVINLIDAGLDHDLALCEVLYQNNLSDDVILTTTYLKQNKFTR